MINVIDHTVRYVDHVIEKETVSAIYFYRSIYTERKNKQLFMI